MQILEIEDDDGGGVAICMDEATGCEESHPVPSLMPPSPANPREVDDITSLHFIHEAAILSNLEVRARMEPPKPYT